MSDTLGEASQYYLRNAIGNMSMPLSTPGTNTRPQISARRSIGGPGPVEMPVIDNLANTRHNITRNGSPQVTQANTTTNNATPLNHNNRRSTGALTPSNRATPTMGDQTVPGLGDQGTAITELVPEAPSPDEMVIRCKGRRSFPIQWSPIALTSPQKLAKVTPTKFTSSLTLRSSPRKRLQLNDISSSDLAENRKNLVNSSPLAKRTCLSPPESTPASGALKNISKHQLVNILTSLIEKHPELKEEVTELLTQPDVKSMEEQLRIVKKEIFKALPTNRLTSKTDSRAFCKAVPHIATFKKTIEDHCKVLKENSKWEDLLTYTMSAWGCVRSLPAWDSPAHFNCTQKAAYKILSEFCSCALQKQQWKDKKQVQNVQEKLEQYKVDHPDMQSCINFLMSIDLPDEAMES